MLANVSNPYINVNVLPGNIASVTYIDRIVMLHVKTNIYF